MSFEQLTLSFLIFSIVVWLCRQVWGWVRSHRPRVKLGDWMTGTVYIAWDRSIPDETRIIKIGVTQKRDVRERMEGIRCTMGGDPVCVWKMDHVPFPYAVEYAAHALMHKHRVVWMRGSTRGREWFYAVGDKGMNRAIAAIEKACRRVRKAALAKKRWSAKADMYISVWKLSEGRISRTYPFRAVSPQVERDGKPGGNGHKKKIRTGSLPPPAQPCSRPRAAAVPGGRYSRGRTRT